MHALSLLPFLLVTACFSVPSIRGANVPNSDVPNLPSSFIRPTTAPVFVALLTGFYSYSCPQDGKWQFNGASGQVFDISNLVGTAEFTNIQFDAFNDMSGSGTTNPLDPTFAKTIENKYGIQRLGQYSDKDGDPEVDFSSSGGGSVVTDVTVDAKSPSNSTAVDWLETEAKSGSLAKTVLLIGTVGGQAPIDGCEPGDPPAMSQICAQLWGFPS